ncbi:hypothetical protein GCM10010413_46940 [Promicromonospora sukumoe]|uniref:Uncharacterized protein n=1 Tax=Promicromonospora sukumoe TaxID=88382 RepID=A0A7W3JCD4_9MICO|nr:hypothetical protein [Promicromonospora sukumoe]MBA8810258.1 hypothetical protein [Promicromonospora sukumoe]
MTDSLRAIYATSGILCVLAAIVSGGVKAAGWELPVIETVWVRVTLAFFGASLLLVGAFYPAVLARLARPKMSTYVVTTRTSSITSTSGSLANPRVKSSTWGGDKIEISAARYERSGDGTSYTFFDSDGHPVREIWRSEVAKIERRDD